MSVSRVAGVVLRPRQATTSLLQRRFASTHSHDEHHEEHHGEHQDAVAFPKEDFSSPIWRNFVLFGLAVVGFYKFAPAPGEDNVVSRTIAHYSTPGEVWERLTQNNLLLAVEASDDNLLVADAKRPPVHRYRYPQKLEQFSPHLQPVGRGVDLSNVVVKQD